MRSGDDVVEAGEAVNDSVGEAVGRRRPGVLVGAGVRLLRAGVGDGVALLGAAVAGRREEWGALVGREAGRVVGFAVTGPAAGAVVVYSNWQDSIPLKQKENVEISPYGTYRCTGP